MVVGRRGELRDYLDRGISLERGQKVRDLGAPPDSERGECRSKSVKSTIEGQRGKSLKSGELLVAFGGAVSPKNKIGSNLLGKHEGENND